MALLHVCAKVYQPPLRGKVEMLSSVDEGAKKILELAYNIKPEKFSHLLVPSEELVEEPVDTNDEGVDVKILCSGLPLLKVYPPVSLRF